MKLYVILLVVAMAAFGFVSGQISFEEEEEELPKVSNEQDVVMTRLGILQSLLDLKPVKGTAAIGEKNIENGPTAKQPSPFIPQGAPPTGNCLCVPQGKCQLPTPVPPQPPVPVPQPIPVPPPQPVPVPVPPPQPVPVPVPPPQPVPVPVPPPQPVPVPVPPPQPVPVPPIPAPGPENTDGAGLIDIRIVNKPPGVRCQQNFEYCCNQAPFPVGPPPPPSAVSGCGTSKPIPVPGYELDPTQSKFGEFPWMVVILGPNNNYVGGGVLISPKHVLTAGHKVFNYAATPGLKVRLGEWDAKANVEPLKYVEVAIAKVRINPFFNRANLQNDVAILTLDAPVDLSAFPHVNTACMPKFTDNFVGQRCWVTGWGKDAFGPPGNFQYILKKVDVPVLDSNDCENRLRLTRLGQFFQLSRSSFVCAGGELGKDACSGDGGSPLVCEAEGRAVVVGLVAWGIGCADATIPGVYVNVRSYIDWINSELV